MLEGRLNRKPKTGLFPKRTGRDCEGGRLPSVLTFAGVFL